MHSSKKKKLSIKLLLLGHLNRTALSKDETVLSLRLIARCSQLLNFLCSFGLKQLQPHAILKIDLSSSRHMRKRHIINERKPSIQHLHILGYTCYLTKDGENLDKMKEKGDPYILVGYSTQPCSLMIKALDYDNYGFIPQLQKFSPSTDTSVPLQQELELLFGPLYDEFFNA
ncbi:hypothetical protein Tco_0235180, partial [Tanacetum coccineum]